LTETTDASALDHSAWTSLTGPHARFAEIVGHAARYPADVSPFAAIDPRGGVQAWDDLAALLGPGGMAPVSGAGLVPPDDWEVVVRIAGVQMIDMAVAAVEDPETIRLGGPDVPEMLELVGRTQPGPFLRRTIEMGNYLGIRRNGILVAMAGERLHPPGWTEISAVCTDEAYRGQGLGSRLVKAVVAGIRQRRESAFLHATASNVNAIRLYESLGFALRAPVLFQAVRVRGGTTIEESTGPGGS
jgi:ribosomal protein S18 acetylase RimI-like enzyme